MPPAPKPTGSRLRDDAPGPQARPPTAAGGPLVPRTWRRGVALLVVLTVVWVGALALAVHGSRGPLAVERPLNDALADSRHYLDRPALFFAGLNKRPGLATLLVIMAVVCGAARSWRAPAALVFSLPATLAVCEVLKEVVARRQVLGNLTFPSGHVAVSSVLATIVVLLVRRGGPLGRQLPVPLVGATITAVGLAVLAVACSMVILGDHYVTDTLAAAPIGVAVTSVVATAIDALAGRFAPGR